MAGSAAVCGREGDEPEVVGPSGRATFNHWD